MEMITNINDKKIKSILESILFAYGEPITAEDILKATKLEVGLKDLIKFLEELIEEYSQSDRGILIFKMNNKYQMGTNKKNCDYIKAVLNPQKKKTLTEAAVETLTIITYKQPVTKVEIEDIRGVKCDGVISTLSEMNLIQEAGRLDKIGKPILYKTTDETLKLFEIKSLKELPALESFANEKFNQ